MARGVKVPDDVRAQVISELVLGLGVMEASRKYKLPESTVRGFLSSSEFAEVRAKKSDEFGLLIEGMLRENFHTLKAMAEHCRDKEYLNRQPIGELGMTYGIISDKTIRILEAAERQGSELTSESS